ncbi:hypothetical protein R6V09_37320 [Streptomyces sp. W16]|uniref:hypothetical protein n=1 Tax=Streptomyces sp. W16 TaxID=3076631 RepID=UPI00295A73FD|nr:hypothetical protein [Streptomyces sp. W16]MDV9175764.1 hypothetical protein [Streptomyces sp. W16]
MKKILLTTGLVALPTAATAAPTMAISDSGSTPLPGTGAKVQVTAWQCSSYADKCSFKSGVKAFASACAND